MADPKKRRVSGEDRGLGGEVLAFARKTQKLLDEQVTPSDNGWRGRTVRQLTSNVDKAYVALRMGMLGVEGASPVEYEAANAALRDACYLMAGRLLHLAVVAGMEKEETEHGPG